MFIVFLAVVFLLSLFVTKLYINFAQKKNWLDVPNQRSSHTIATPRGGGLVFICIWLVCAILGVFLYKWPVEEAWILLPGTIVVAAVGFYDDRHSLPAKHRGFFYLLAAILPVIAMGGFDHLLLAKHLLLPLFFLGSIFAVLSIVWSTNLFNFMDGIDAIAGIEALFILSFGGMFLWGAGGHAVAIVAWLLLAAVLGFLVWNKPKAKIFMGDVGAASLGFIIMVLAFLGETRYQVPFILWLILYGAFLFDATITLIRRIVSGATWYEAHRSHAYQRLHQAGWGHGKVVVALMALNTLLAVLACVGYYYRDATVFVGFSALLLLWGAYAWVERLKPMTAR